MNVALGLMFLFIGVAHFAGVGARASADHYVDRFGEGGATYRWVVGVVLLALGVNFLAAGAGLPHVNWP